MTLPVDGIKLHRGNFAAIGQQIQPLLDAGQCFRLQVKPWREKRSLSQNALSHMWYTEISEYLINSGRTDATADWVKRNLKKTYLGCEEVTYTDFVTGEWMRYSADVAKPGRWTITARVRSAKGGRIGIDERGVTVPPGSAWQSIKLADIDLPAGPGAATLRAIDCGDCEVESLTFAPR